LFGIGGFELFIILIFGFLIFGPEKLPDIAKTVGKGIARFREAQQEVNEAIGDEKLIDLNNPDEPFKDPVEALDRIAKRHEEKLAAEKAPDSDGANDASGSDSDEQKQESFTERKARYERERAARKAAEAEAAKSTDPAGAPPEPPAVDSPELALANAATPEPPTAPELAAAPEPATTAEGGDE